MEVALQAKAYGAVLLLLNVAASTSIIFTNKLVLSIYKFDFPYALTLMHTLVTLAGMLLFSSLGFYRCKPVPKLQVAPLAGAFVAYVVLWNICLRLNCITFFQLSKIMITPGVVLLQTLLYGLVPSRQELAAILVLCTGVGLATVSGGQIDTTLAGATVAAAAVAVTALYQAAEGALQTETSDAQVWVGSMQKQLSLSSMQLMHEYVPQATLMLAVLVPLVEPLGLDTATSSAPGTLMAYRWTVARALAVAVSSLLGLAVSLTMFLAIGVVGSLTYNVSGQLKTVTILLGGVFLFGDEIGPRKLMGVLLAMSGISWYTWMQLFSRAVLPATAVDKDSSQHEGSLKAHSMSRDGECEHLLKIQRLPSVGTAPGQLVGTVPDQPRRLPG